MARSTNDRIKAFHLYCEEVSQERIAQVIGCGKATIAVWIKKYKWKNEREKLIPLVKESNKTNTDKLNEELLKSIKRVWEKQVGEDKAKTNARDVIETIKLERLLAGKSTEITEVQGKSLEEAYVEYLAKRKKEEK